MNISYLSFAAIMLVLSASVVCDAQRTASDEIDRYVKSQMEKRKIPGLQLVVVKEGKIVKSKSYGLANVELNAPVTDDTVFEIASNSKQFTAGGVMLLTQDGKLNLDDSITRYLSALPGTYDAITVRQLLNHTSGVKDYIEEFQLNRSLNYTNAELIEKIGANALNFPPGTDARYSTTGYLLLGLIIEQITGKPYGDFLKERIFDPLGMSRTQVISIADITTNRASGYRLDKGYLINGRYVAQTLRASADIGLMTTALDVAKWDAALRSTRIFTPYSIDSMFTPARLKDGSFAYNDWNGYFGLGWFIDDHFGHRQINHGGTFITGFSAEIARYVDKKLTVIILANRVPSDPATIGYAVAGFFDAELIPPFRHTAKKDPSPSRTIRLRQWLAHAKAGTVDLDHLTHGFRSRLKPDQKTDIAEFMTEPSEFTYIDCAQTGKRAVERFGSRVLEICHYKVARADEVHFISFYLTSRGHIADLWILSNVN